MQNTYVVHKCTQIYCAGYLLKPTPNKIQATFTNEEEMVNNIQYLPGIGQTVIMFVLNSIWFAIVLSCKILLGNLRHADFEKNVSVYWKNWMEDMLKLINFIWCLAHTYIQSLIRLFTIAYQWISLKLHRSIYTTCNALSLKNKFGDNILKPNYLLKYVYCKVRNSY